MTILCAVMGSIIILQSITIGTLVTLMKEENEENEGANKKEYTIK